MVAIPELSDEVRAAALVKATAVRSARRAFKQEVSEGKFSLESAIAHAKKDEALAGIRVVDLLQCLPRIGPKRATELMKEFDIAASRRVRGLGEKQVASLVTWDAR